MWFAHQNIIILNYQIIYLKINGTCIRISFKRLYKPKIYFKPIFFVDSTDVGRCVYVSSSFRPVYVCAYAYL